MNRGANAASRRTRASRVATALAMGVREYVRTPVLVVLLAVLPVYFIGVVGYVTPDVEVPITVADRTVRVGMAEMYATLAAPLTGALVGGIAGLFVMRATRQADARLVLAGYRPTEVVTARVGVLAGVCLALTGVSLGVLSWTAAPDRLAWFGAATLLAALTYALVGALVGTLLGRLAGVYAMLFAPTLDVFLFQNPTAADASARAAWLPGHYAVAAAMDAAFGSGFDATPLLEGLGYLGVVVAVAAAAFYRSVKA